MNHLRIVMESRPEPCRLCGGPTTVSFTAKILKKYPADFHRCDRCGSMQTDSPYWLDESYAVVHSATDTGMAARTLQMAQLTSLLLRIVGVGSQTQCLDWGGGNGLFCRMMRDQGYNFFNYDKYAEPFYCAGFTAKDAGIAKCDIVTAFEVFEHLPDPKTELADILRFQPKLWIFSTQLYENQGPDWKYFGPGLGRHVFFYSEQALHEFAGAHGYRFIRGRHLHLFAKRSDNPYFRSGFVQRRIRRILNGGKLAGLAAGLHFLVRQHHAYRYWQSDSDRVRVQTERSERP
ncbi:MAG TPA: class I SAM-dependent methyltransferase [Micropepsaceae bacterium]|nr:class I SAM-dependent methyltransferase [Micropepsaceae bacterium]